MDVNRVRSELAGVEKGYTDFIKSYFENWEVWGNASERVYQGEDVSESEIPKAFHTEMKMMKMILKMEAAGEFDWNNPGVRKMFSEFSQSPFYTFFGDTVVEIAFRLAKLVGAGSMIEIGAGSGNLTRKMVNLMKKNDNFYPLLLTDNKPIVLEQPENIMKESGFENIKSVIWDIANKPSQDIKSFLKSPVVCYERYTVTYTSPAVIKNIAEVADVLVMGDWLCNTDQVFGYDKVFSKIGAKRILFSDVKRELDNFYSHYYFFDKAAQDAIKSPYTGLMIALKDDRR